jgi:hypothetical protein
VPDRYVGPILLATFALVGVWMVVSPADVVGWYWSARPDVRRNPDFTENNPAVISFVKFMGSLFIEITVLVFVTFMFAR